MKPCLTLVKTEVFILKKEPLLYVNICERVDYRVKTNGQVFWVIVRIEDEFFWRN